MHENHDNVDSLMEMNLFDSESASQEVAETAQEATEVVSEAVTETVEAATTTETPEPAAAPATAAPATVNPVARRRAGRRVDLNGTTALGAARLLYAANPGLDSKALSALLVTELKARFGTKKSVAHTYACMVRKGSGTK